MKYQAFADRLQEALQKKDKDKGKGNQSKLARAVGVTSQAVSKWLKGSQFPRPEVLALTASYLGVTPEYLQFGTPTVGAQASEQFDLAYIRPDERELLTHYRESTEVGKMQMRAAAVNTEKLPAKELPPKR